MYEKFITKKYAGRILLLTHTDLDGYGSEVILNVLSQRKDFKARFPEFDVIHVSTSSMNRVIRETCLNEDTWDEYDTIFITDISCTTETGDMIMESGHAGQIALLDHHKTALGLNKFPFAVVSVTDEPNEAEWRLPRQGNECRMACGTSLFMGFIMGLYNEADWETSSQYKNLVKFVSQVAAWDTWDWHNVYDGAAAPGNLNKLCRHFSSSLFAEKMLRTINGPYIDGDIMSDTLLSDVDRYLLRIYNEKSEEYLRNIPENWKATRMEMVIPGKNRPYRLAMLSSSEYITEVFQMMYEMDSERLYDIYAIDFGTGISLRSIKEDVDVSFIAAQHGGGGHVHAAGFSYREQKTQFIKELLS